VAEQLSMFPGEDEAKYQAFVDKFKPKKTTDDCYTPDNIYRTVAAWVAREYGLGPASFVRPFWPGGDYEAFEYPDGCVVVDNPPFSLLARIKAFYIRRGIRFFLFAPTLTLFSSNQDDVCYIPCGVQITYANGAVVNSSFVTNLDRWLVRTAPDLYRAIKRVNDANEKAAAKQLPKYVYPDCVLTAAASYRLSKYGVDYRLERGDATFIRRLDAMKARGKDSGIFSGAWLLSERAAAERAAAERAAAERAAAERAAATVWELSERERRIVAGLGDGTPKSLPPMGKVAPASPGSDEVPGSPRPHPDPFDLSALMSMPKEVT